MDNYQTGMVGAMPPMQPVQPNMMPGSPMPNGMGAGTPNNMANGMPMVQQVTVTPEEEKDVAGLVKTIVIIVLALVAVTFIGLFIWMTVQYNDVQSNVQEQIDMEVAKAKDEQASKMEAEFLEREKYPFKTFSGPMDYGQLTFEYPKTWSVYVEKAATAGGDFNAYFNPIQVDAVGKDTINALRVVIRDKGFDEVAEEYKKVMDRKDSGLTMEATTIGKNGDIVANRYTGKIPNTELNGFIVMFKIRDKAAILQTDSVLFQADFDKLLGTVTFNQ